MQDPSGICLPSFSGYFIDPYGAADICMMRAASSHEVASLNEIPGRGCLIHVMSSDADSSLLPFLQVDCRLDQLHKLIYPAAIVHLVLKTASV